MQLCRFPSAEAAERWINDGGMPRYVHMLRLDCTLNWLN